MNPRQLNKRRQARSNRSPRILFEILPSIILFNTFKWQHVSASWNGSWGTAAHWINQNAPQNGGFPDESTDLAIFEGAYTSNVSLSANVTIGGLEILAGHDLTLELNGHTLTIANEINILGNSRLTIINSEAAGSLSLSAGSLTIGKSHLGTDESDASEFILSGEDVKVSLSGSAAVGTGDGNTYAPAGTLWITNGARMGVAGSLTIGRPAGISISGIGAVNVAFGSYLAVAEDIIVNSDSSLFVDEVCQVDVTGDIHLGQVGSHPAGRLLVNRSIDDNFYNLTVGGEILVFNGALSGNGRILASITSQSSSLLSITPGSASDPLGFLFINGSLDVSNSGLEIHSLLDPVSGYSSALVIAGVLLVGSCNVTVGATATSGDAFGNGDWVAIVGAEYSGPFANASTALNDNLNIDYGTGWNLQWLNDVGLIGDPAGWEGYDLEGEGEFALVYRHGGGYE